MAQFDVYENPNPDSGDSIPYLLDVQADLLDQLATRVVVPLVKVEIMGKAARHLNPTFTIEQTPVVMSTTELAGVNLRNLGRKICSLREMRSEILAALDFLFTGF